MLSSDIRKYDILDGSLVDEDTVYFSPEGLLPNSPVIYGTRLYLDSTVHYLYDYELMETITKFTIHSQDGSVRKAEEMTMSPDGEYCYFMVAPDKIFKYQLTTDSIVDSLFLIYGAFVGDMECTSDGRFLLVSEVAPVMDWWTLGTLAIIDLESFTMFRRICTYGVHPDFPAQQLRLGSIAILPDASRAYSVTDNAISATPPVSFNLFEYTPTLIKGLRLNCGSSSVAVGGSYD
jgi:hypothetical protein